MKKFQEQTGFGFTTLIINPLPVADRASAVCTVPGTPLVIVRAVPHHGGQTLGDKRLGHVHTAYEKLTVKNSVEDTDLNWIRFQQIYGSGSGAPALNLL